MPTQTCTSALCQALDESRDAGQESRERNAFVKRFAPKVFTLDIVCTLAAENCTLKIHRHRVVEKEDSLAHARGRGDAPCNALHGKAARPMKLFRRASAIDNLLRDCSSTDVSIVQLFCSKTLFSLGFFFYLL